MTLGRANVDAMLRSLTAKQFRAWEDYARLEPLDAEANRADWRAAQITKAVFDVGQRIVDVVLAANGVPRHQRPKTVDLAVKDFKLTWTTTEPDAAPTPPPAKPTQTWQEQWTVIERIMQAHGHAIDADARSRN